MEKAPTSAPAISTSQSSPSTPRAVLEGLARQASTESLDVPDCFPQLATPLLQAMPYWLETWRTNLVTLQPKVVMDDAALAGAVVLVRALFQRRTDLRRVLSTSPPHLAAYAAAAMWTSSKIVGVRTQSPNRSLMAQAAGCHPAALADYELDLCCSINWDMAAYLREADLLC